MTKLSDMRESTQNFDKTSTMFENRLLTAKIRIDGTVTK